MSLVYALVARGNKILAEYTDSSGNFTTVTQSILDRIPDKDAKCTYVYDRSAGCCPDLIPQISLPLCSRGWDCVSLYGG